mmetsp:Transcript_24468/g.24052  ORF Transcript_24468/g.24052 Transcript_24468/m.24052 type:complete len:83 (-) Transcript_24468:905-1153(-)
MDIYYDDRSVDSFEAYGEKLCKTQRNPLRNEYPREPKKSYINHVIDFGANSSNENSQELADGTVPSPVNFNPYQSQTKKGMK